MKHRFAERGTSVAICEHCGLYLYAVLTLVPHPGPGVPYAVAAPRVRNAAGEMVEPSRVPCRALPGVPR